MQEELDFMLASFGKISELMYLLEKRVQDIEEMLKTPQM